MKIIDLTMPLDENTPIFPGDEEPEFLQTGTIAKEGFNMKSIKISSHTGTHMDAPSHMLDEGATLDEYSIDRFIGEAVVIDARKTGEGNEIIVSEKELAVIRKNDIVLFWTGHTEKAGTSGFFRDNPVISEKIARQLAAKGVKMVGIDSFTPDNEPYESHKILFEGNIPIVENLVNLDKLKGKIFTCYILPLNITEADGAPCRAIAVLE